MAQEGSKGMDSSDNEVVTRIYVRETDVEEEDIRYCQEQTVEWVSELLTLTGGFGEVDPSQVQYGPQTAKVWNDLNVPSRTKLNALNKPVLLDLVEGACRILIEQSFPVTEELSTVGYETLKINELEKELKKQSKELIKTQRALVAAQEELIGIQKQLLEKREVEITAVQSTAQQEMKSFASVLEKECASALAPKKIQSAIVAASEDRGCNIIIHGLEELKNSTDSDELETQIKSLFSELEEAPKVESVERLGKQSSSARPVKVVLRSKTAQMSVLSKKSRLKGTDKFRKVFISPDRTVEERKERKKLVVELKDMVKRSPGTHYIIRGKRVLEAPRDTN